MPKISRMTGAESRYLGMGLLSCVLVSALFELLLWSEPGAVTLWGVSSRVKEGGDNFSPLPDIADHVLRKTIQHGKLVIDINMNYPSLGNADVDVDVQRWIAGIAEAFVENLADDADDAYRDREQSFALHGSYTVSRPSEAAVSLIFRLWTYTGGAHGNLDIITLNYSLLNGQRLEFVDLFEDSEEALKLMSDWSFQALARRFAGAPAMQMIRDGTSPDAQNFASLALTPEGVVIHFQPYQVAPWAAGAQEVEMPFEKLLPAGPLAAIWGKKSSL
jgi:hypothetical protein